MKSLLLVVALCGTLVCTLPIGTEDEHISDKDMAFAKKYMENYDPDYENAPFPRSKIINSHTAAEKMQEIQKLFQLQVTGKVDSTTLDAMKMPMCGIDAEDFKLYPNSPKWQKKVITYSIENYTQDMNREDVDESIEKAWKVWSDVTPLTFIRVYDDSADIKIFFTVGKHGDGNDFDGPGEKLAHAFRPGNYAINGDVHFDDDEFWSKDFTGKNLELVAVHEFGHSLGLDNSDVHDALMFERYQPKKFKNIRLHQDDIDGVQTLYGPHVNSPSAKNMLTPPEAPLQELGNQNDKMPNLKKRTRSPQIPDIQAKIPEM